METLELRKKRMLTRITGGKRVYSRKSNLNLDLEVETMWYTILHQQKMCENRWVGASIVTDHKVCPVKIAEGTAPYFE